MLWVLLTPAWAVAQAPFDRKYAEATEQYRAGRYDEALAGFKAAYELDPLPGILFNMGQACLHLNQALEALRYYDRYEQAKPDLDPRDRQKLDAARAEANARLAQAAPPVPAPAPAPAPVPVPAPAAVAQQALPPSVIVAKTEIDVHRAPAHKPIYKRWWFWGSLGLVAAGGLAAGLALGLGSSHSNANCPGCPGYPIWTPGF